MNRSWKFILLIILANGLWAQEGKFLEFKAIQTGTLKSGGFTLQRGKAIRIDAEGAGEEKSADKDKSFMVDPENMFAYAWIINARTRELQWRMTISNTRRDWDTRFNRKFGDEVYLPAGEYEIYYSAERPAKTLTQDGFFSLGKLLDKLLSDENWLDKDEEKWYLKVSGVDEVLSQSFIRKYHAGRKQQAVVSITGLENSDFKKEGFALSSAGTFSIYGIGEAYEDESFDYGWIVNARNSEKVWEMTPEKGKYAGGAIKNKVWRDKINIPAGEYWVYFIMDDSHAPNEWNANPPYDPAFYGITIEGIPGEYDPGSIKKLTQTTVKPIVDLTHLGNDQFVQEAFRIKEPMQIRINAVGEGRDGKMFDYGWIVRTNTGEKVWEMKYNRTRHAGGARKNRMVDEVITLPVGTYAVYFVTDGSHSYPDFNDDPPYNPERWGISIYPADPKYNESQVERLEETPVPENIIAQIAPVQDDVNAQERFSLDKKSRIRVYAIGEGDWDEMYDYGWIEDQYSGRKVWQMTYNKTEWAGGAKKNRKVDQTITLPAGRYIVYFRTDGSHSFSDWNDDPPKDPSHYGISLYLISDNKGDEK